MYRTKTILGINSGSSFRNTPNILELYDSIVTIFQFFARVVFSHGAGLFCINNILVFILFVVCTLHVLVCF